MKTTKIIQDTEKMLQAKFAEYEETAYLNQIKLLNVFKAHHVREYHFQPSSGYGYGDVGRDLLEEIYADLFACEDAMVRLQIVSGTHAISSCLFGLLRPGDELVSLTGKPYDTLSNVIGRNSAPRGTLIEKGIEYREIALNEHGVPDGESITEAITPQTTMALIQRSRGYSLRPALAVADIAKLCMLVKQKNPMTVVLVDNCYGEFVEAQEPSQTGADLIAGSLIKNPGGGLASSGGYIAGKKDLVEQIAYHLTAPGLGKALGSNPASKRDLYQGLFVAPHVVLQALKGAALLAAVFDRLGYEVSPHWDEPRADIVQAVKLKNADQVRRFCQIVQTNSPVDSDVSLEFGGMPGYAERIIMAAGTFIQGSSIELSCDAPLREPYCAFLQGGLTYEHCRYVVAQLVDGLIVNG